MVTRRLTFGLLGLLAACHGGGAPPVSSDGPSAEGTPTTHEPVSSESGALTIDTPPPAVVLAAGPFEVAGTASVWEGRLGVRLLLQGATLDEQHVSAEASAPARGRWTATLTVPAQARGPAVVEAWTASARDGSPENVVRLPVVLR